MTTTGTTTTANPMRRLIITLVAIAAGMFLIFKLIQADDARMTAEAQATIVSQTPSSEGSGQDVEFTWVVNGNTHRSQETDNQWIKNVESVKVCYDPESPGAGSLVPGDKKCGT